MRIKIFLLLFVVFASTVASIQAQVSVPSVTNTNGGNNTYLNITYEWSVGELALVESMLEKDYTLTNGQLQPQKIVPADILNGYNIVPNNILSTNPDGINDTWVINYLDQYPENEISLFDRAGRLVYFVQNYQNNWKGDQSGALLPEDTYYYIIKLKKAGQTGIKKGYLTIIKN